ncbi:MAG TPA: hypothetical protein VFK94_03990 [Patescibacteria group bacterium]|nr:hypothetical protein [Patescibacteria group bacterium]
MPVTLVPDPLHPESSRTPAPLMVKADAMRKLYAAGTPVAEIALRYGVTYHNAYKQINPPRKRAGAAGSTESKPLTKERLTQLPKKRLIEIATSKGKTPSELARIQAAANELDRRDPNWLDKL